MNNRIRTLIALAATAIALMGLSSAASAATFGANVDTSTVPTYSTEHNACTGLAYLHEQCTWLLEDGYNRPSGSAASISGELHKIQLVAGGPGKFRLQIVRERTSDRAAKLVEQGPTIHYQGQDGSTANGSEVETFRLHGLHVHAGDRLALAAKHTSVMACGPEGSKTIGSSTAIYTPVLSSPMFQGLGSANGCQMLIEGFVR
jgi:hypothetical protein